MKPTAFPLDFDALQKGTVIRSATIEVAIGRLRGDEHYRLGVMSLVEQIQRERPDLAAHARSCGEDIVVMTDEEAEEYQWKRTRHHVRGLSRVASRRSTIDRSGFDDEHRRIGEHRDAVVTMMSLSLRKQLAKATREERLLGGDDKGADGDKPPPADAPRESSS